jgi:hypothetical protein
VFEMIRIIPKGVPTPRRDDDEMIRIIPARVAEGVRDDPDHPEGGADPSAR